MCDDNWTNTNAQVVCQQLGFGSSSASVDFDVPAGTGPILMDDVNCISGQTNLLACSHNGFGNHNCRHDEDVGVTCSKPSIGMWTSLKHNIKALEIQWSIGMSLYYHMPCSIAIHK